MTKVGRYLVKSANYIYLMFAIILFGVEIFALSTIVYTWCTESLGSAIAITLILGVLLTVMSFISISCFKLWKNRAEFIIYKCDLTSQTNIDYIKNNFSVMYTTQDYIVFVKKKMKTNIDHMNYFMRYINYSIQMIILMNVTGDFQVAKMLHTK